MTFATLYTQKFIVCPWCHGRSGHRIDHLFQGQSRDFGPWSCEKCHRSFRGTVDMTAPTVLVKIEKAESDPGRRTLALLRFDGADGPVFFVLEAGRRRVGDGKMDHEFSDGLKFLYEEHSCPTNWIGTCEMIIQGDDTDPHGFLEFVADAQVPDGVEVNDMDILSVFPQIKALS